MADVKSPVVKEFVESFIALTRGTDGSDLPDKAVAKLQAIAVQIDERVDKGTFPAVSSGNVQDLIVIARVMPKKDAPQPDKV